MIRYAKRLTALLTALILTFICVGGALAEGFAAIVKVQDMAVYGDEDLFEKLGTLSKDTVVTVLSYDGEVAKISYRGYEGYAETDDMASLDSVSKPAVITSNTRVYLTASTSAKSARIAKNTRVNLLSDNGTWAQIEKNGYVAWIKSANLMTELFDDSATPAPTAKLGRNDVVTSNFTATVSVDKLNVYASASTRGKRLGTLKKGTVINVRAYNRTWAYVELNGKYGYCKHSGLTRGGEIAPTATPEPEATPTPAPTAKVPAIDYSSSQYSNEEIIYAFLIREMHMNCAAACGVLANIRAESNFRSDIANSIGAYGLCQWYKGRRTRLENYCAEHGYDSASVEGQMWYLKYELENYYTGTLNYMLEVDNTAQGAYDAAYYWCYHFEIPENRASNSAKRGSSAQNTYWPKYSAK